MTSPTSGGTADVVWVDVLPSLQKFVPAMRATLAGARGEAAAAGASAGDAFGASFGSRAAASMDAASSKLSLSQKRLADAQGALNVQLARLGDLMDSDTVSAGRLAAANEAVAKAQRGVQVQTDAVASAQAGLARVETDVAVATKAQGDAAGAAAAKTAEAGVASKAFTGALGFVRGALGQVSGALKTFAPIAIGAAFYEVIKSAQAFDASMLTIQTQAGATAAEVARMKPAILSMAGQVAQTPEALATSLYHVESTGIRGAQALNVVAAAAKFATVAHANLEETTNALTASVVSGIPGINTMDQAIGLLNATVGTGDMRLSDLNDALGSGVLSVVKGYGLSMRDVAAALATFGDNNIRGAAASTQLRLSVQAMAVPVAAGRKILDGLGISSKQLADDMAHGGLNQALTDLRDHLTKAGVGGNQVGEILTAAFGKKAGPGLAVLLGQFDRLQSKYEAVDKATNTFGKEWDATQQSAAYAFSSFKAGFQALAIQIGNALLPFLTTVVTGLAGFFRALETGAGPVGTVEKAVQQLGQYLAYLWQQIKGPVKDAVGILLLALDLLVKGFSAVAGWINTHRTLVTSLAAAWLVLVAAQKISAAVMAVMAAGGFIKWLTGVVTNTKLWSGAMAILNLIMDANPIALVVIAIAALAAGFVYAYTHSARFRQIIADIWQGLKDFAGWIVTGFKAAIDWIVDHWKLLVFAIPLVGPAIGAIIAIVTHFGDIWRTVVNGLKTAWDAVLGALKSAWNTFWGGLTTGVSAVVGAFKVVWDGLTTAWHAVATAFKAVWDSVLHPVFDAFMAVARVVAIVVGVLVLGPIALAWAGIKIAISAAVDGIKQAWQGMQIVWGVVWGVLKQAWDGMKVAWSVLWDEAKRTYDNVILPTWHAIQTGAEWLWHTVLQPIYDGLRAAWDVLWAAMTAVYRNVILPAWDGIKAAAQAIWDFLVARWDTLRANLTAVWDAIVNFFVLRWDQFRTDVQNIAQAVWDFLVLRWTTLRDNSIAIWNDVTTTVTRLWNDFKTVVVNVAHDIWQGVTGFFNTMSTDVQKIWGAVVTGVQSTWDTIEAIVATPINFIIKDVFDDGLFKAWNWVVHTLGLPGGWEAPVWPQLPKGHQFAAGGSIPGPWMGPTADNVMASVAGGGMIRVNPREWIQPVASVDYYGSGFMSAIQSRAIDRKALSGALAMMGAGFANGGQIPRYDSGGQISVPLAVTAAMANPFNPAGALLQIDSWLSGTTDGSGVGGQTHGSWSTILEAIPKKLYSGLWNATKGAISNALSGRQAQAQAAQASSAGLSGIPGGLVTGPIADIIAKAAAPFGWSTGNEWAGINYIVSHESGFNPNAKNPTSTAYGLFQFLDGTWASVGGFKTPDPYAQSVYGMRYIKQKYGDPINAEQFWQRNHWYSGGGPVPQLLDSGGMWNPGLGLNATGGVERVLSPEHDHYFQDLVDWANGPTTSKGGIDVGGVHINMQSANPYEVADELVYRLRVAGRGGVYSTMGR